MAVKAFKNSAGRLKHKGVWIPRGATGTGSTRLTRTGSTEYAEVRQGKLWEFKMKSYFGYMCRVILDICAVFGPATADFMLSNGAPRLENYD